MTGLSIGEVAKRAGVRTSALRYYEQVGLLPPQLRSHGTHGQRRYDPGVLNTLALIAFAKHAGFTIADTRQLLSGFDKTIRAPERWREVAQRKQQELDALIARATAMKRALQAVQRCQCSTLTQCGQHFRAQGHVAGVHLTGK